MGSADKGKSKRCVYITVAAIIVLLLLSVGGNSGLGYFLYKIIPFSVPGVKSLFTNCNSCPPCLICLGGGTDEVKIKCDPFRNLLQCASQLIYLFSTPSLHPCSNECFKCQQCLSDTTFGSINRLNTTMWQSMFPDVFQPSKPLLPNVSGIPQRKKRTTPDPCCGTEIITFPYFNASTIKDGEKWNVVWLANPDKNTTELQYYPRGGCLSANSGCGQHGCALTITTRVFLMTTQLPYYPEWGYSYNLLTLPDPSVKFIDVDKPGYCRCA